MARFFRFRVREGQEVVEFDDKRATNRGAGYELLLTEAEAARWLRDRRTRAVLDLVEIVEDEAVRPQVEQPERD